MAGEIFDYFAFISYSHADKETAQKLQKRLERYHMPAKLLQAHPELPKKLSPIFRDESDISGKGTLIETLHDNLRRSQYLILICSPSSAKSEYVNDEVDYFINTLHREDRIIPLIVGGIPRSKDESIECFPPAILALDREREPLGIDLKTLGKRDAFLKVIATLLRLNFTYFKNREDEERKRRLKIFASVATVLALIVGVLGWYSIDIWKLIVTDDAETQFTLGVAYYSKQNYVKAMEYFQTPAAQGYVYAQYAIGYMYMDGLGVKLNYAKAMEWFQKVAAQEATAQGSITAQDIITAQLVAQAQFAIGCMYMKGLGVKKDYVKAMECLQKAAAQEVAAQVIAPAQDNIGAMYMEGLGVKKDYAKAMEWFQKAAAQDYAAAQYHIGYMYIKGLGVKPNYAKAMELCQKAAAQGIALAQNDIGYMYMNGLGVKKNYVKAMEWYQKAVAQGNDMAQYNIGYMYMNGLGVEQDYAKAMEWFQKAAAQDNALALYDIGIIYRDGLGVPPNIDKAKNWFSLANEQGHEGAKSELLKLLGLL